MNKINQIINSIEFGSQKSALFTKEQIFSSFKQGTVDLPLFRRIGGGGNCASVALIKAAIGTYGFDNIFNSILIDNRNKRYLIDLKDEKDEIYHLSFDDYEFGSIKSAFEQPIKDDNVSNDIFEFAKFCFAVMAEIKRWDFRKNNKYSRAIHELNKGEDSRYIHDYLGLTVKKVEDVSISNLSQLKNLVVWNSPHAVFSSEGLYDEFFTGYDSILPLNMLQIIHGSGTDKDKPIGAHILV
jgi:hypothetical protein